MLDSVIGAFLDAVSEREFDAPFMALLRAMGFYDVHFTHGSVEFGKDFIAKKDIDGNQYQFAFQTKAVPITFPEIQNQLDVLRTSTLSHPAFSTTRQLRPVLVTTRRMTGQAHLHAQNYQQHLNANGEVSFDVWDRENLIEFFTATPDIALAESQTAEFLELLGLIDQKKATDRSLERYSRNWLDSNTASWRIVLEAAVLANHLARADRLDLAALIGLAVVRAAARSGHGGEPPSTEVEGIAQLGRKTFVGHALSIWARCDDRALDPALLIAGHEPLTAFITYPARCQSLIEMLGLLGLSGAVDGSELNRLVTFLETFIARQTGTAHALSDRAAVAYIPPLLLLSRHGHNQTAATLLKQVVKWVADRYEKGNGLAPVTATVEDAVVRLLGPALEHTEDERRADSYMASVALDLASVLQLEEAFEIARNEFLAVGCLPSVLLSPDTGDQYLIHGKDLRTEPNVPYEPHWTPTDGWKTAPHHRSEPGKRYLDRIGHSWDLLAISALLRDRHFISAMVGLRGAGSAAVVE
jgi:hypothetical protein